VCSVARGLSLSEESCLSNGFVASDFFLYQGSSCPTSFFVPVWFCRIGVFAAEGYFLVAGKFCRTVRDGARAVEQTDSACRLGHRSIKYTDLSMIDRTGQAGCTDHPSFVCVCLCVVLIIRPIRFLSRSNPNVNERRRRRRRRVQNSFVQSRLKC